jgi:hypothetical protein
MRAVFWGGVGAAPVGAGVVAPCTDPGASGSAGWGGSAVGAAGAPARVPSGTFSAPYSTGSRALARCGLSLGSLARSQAMRG